MVHFENGSVRMEGSAAQLCMEATFILKGIHSNIMEITSEEHADNMLNEILDNVKLPKEEILKKYLEGKEEATKNLSDLLAKIIAGGIL